MTSRFPPFAFVELVSPYHKKNITRWLEDMNFMFSWQEQYFTCSLRSLVRYCSCHSNIKFISSRHRVICSIYLPMPMKIFRGHNSRNCHSSRTKINTYLLGIEQVYNNSLRNMGLTLASQISLLQGNNDRKLSITFSFSNIITFT